jgi:4-hydroxy-tetrahydrodipicolinate reductase
MRTIILGDGPMGTAVAGALAEADEPAAAVLGRPGPGGHLAEAFHGVDLCFEMSRGSQVAANLAGALHGGVRTVVIGTTGWEADRSRVEELLAAYGASAVAAANFSLGEALFGRLVESAAALFGAVEAFDPYILEWHRRTKTDRPSGTARELSRRLIAAHPAKRRAADPTHATPPEPDELEVAVIRAGSSPGMHLVGFDAPGETVELRLTARDRTAYAAGALAAGRWLLREPRGPGLHPFDLVVDDLLAPAATRARPPAPTPVH